MQLFTPIIIQTTFPTHIDISSFCADILNNQLAACVHCFNNIQSYYTWNDAVESSKEQLIQIKTIQRLYPDIEKKINHIHPYDTPEIIKLPIEQLSIKYQEWFQSVIKSQ